jgi:thioredoxin-dependent peroxiredoxin
VGASFDSPPANLAFARKFGFSFRLLSDEDRSVGERYEVRRGPDEQSAGLPRRTTYLIDPRGRIARGYLVKDVNGHPAEVLDDLRQLAGR